MKSYAKDLLSMMKNDTKAAWARVQGGTGYGKWWEYMNSSIFAGNNMANFCTVSTSLLIVHRKGKAFF